MADWLEQCSVCTSSSLSPEFRFTDGRGADWQVVRCGGCGLGFINPQPSWEELSPYYSGDYVPYGDSHGADGSDDAVLESARASGQLRHAPIRAGTRVLDAGCGGGWFLRMAGKLGAIVEGVEPSELAAAVARRSWMFSMGRSTITPKPIPANGST